MQNVRTTYKVVADKLVAELKAQTQGMRESDIVRKERQTTSPFAHQSQCLLSTSTLQQKDEQNIKRRVYDALNVLIASGVIAKSGKSV